LIYLDSSALVKLVLNEPETGALRDWLRGATDAGRITSEISWVEVLRVCRRTNDNELPTARGLLAALDFVQLTTELLETATRIDPPVLRSLDAIHLASALSIRDEISAFITYDRRLIAAAENTGLVAVAPL
jgi:predicted nucleic acid-binding protein